MAKDDKQKYRPTWQRRAYPLLDINLLNRDRAWEAGLVSRIRGGGKIEVSSLAEMTVDCWPQAAGSWEAAEEHSKHANRTHAVFLNDEAIAARKPIRELRKAEYAKLVAEQKLIWEVEKKRREEAQAEWDRTHAAEVAERLRAEKEYHERRAELVRRRAEHDAEWQAAEAAKHEQTQKIIAAERARFENLKAGDIQRETQFVMSQMWGCYFCNRPGSLTAHDGSRYTLSCIYCRRTMQFEHTRLMELARKTYGAVTP